MSRYANSNILARGLRLFVVAILLVLAFGFTPVQAAIFTEHSDLLQFTSAGHVLGFQSDGVYIAAGDHMLRVEFAGASGVAPVPDRMPSGDGQAQPLARVTYADLWPGISLSYEHVAGGVVESSYLLEPGADVGQIQLRYNAPVQIEGGSTLRIDYETGHMRESAPVAWQDINGQRIPVEITFILLDSPIHNPAVGFALGQYNPAYPLMIDPTLEWNTFMGSSASYGDVVLAMALDGDGNVHVAGYSYATWGSPVNAFAGAVYPDAFVAKLNSSGVRLWNTFMGCVYNDFANGIAVDVSGDVYVTGQSNITWGSPVHPHAGGDPEGHDAFLAKLNSSGVRLWNTFMGSSDFDRGTGIALDGSGNVYVAGGSWSTWGSPMNPHAGEADAFVAKLNSSNGILQWNTFMGSSDFDFGSSIALDGSGNVYVAGGSESTWGSPVNAHAGGDHDAFVAKLDSSGAFLWWNTFMGSSVDDGCDAIAVDGSGNVYVAGESESTWGSPVNPYAGGLTDAFAAKLDSSGALLWNTFMGSSTSDSGTGIAVDGSGNVYVAGDSHATWGVPENPHAGYWDAFAAQLDSSGVRQWNTFMGSSDSDGGRGIAVDVSGNVYVAGHSMSTWSTPVNPHSGYQDAFVAKLVPSSCHNDVWDEQFCGRDAYVVTGSADMNHDCVVDDLDEALLQEQWGMVGPNLSGDLDGDGLVGSSDYVILASTYGLPVSPCTPWGAAVPTLNAYTFGLLAMLMVVVVATITRRGSISRTSG